MAVRKRQARSLQDKRETCCYIFLYPLPLAKGTFHWSYLLYNTAKFSSYSHIDFSLAETIWSANKVGPKYLLGVSKG